MVMTEVLTSVEKNVTAMRNAEESAFETRKAHLMDAYNKALAYNSEIRDIIDTANECLRKGLCYFNKPDNIISRSKDPRAIKLQSCGIYHALGLYADNNGYFDYTTHFDYIGNESGGCDGMVDICYDGTDIYAVYGKTRTSLRSIILSGQFDKKFPCTNNSQYWWVWSKLEQFPTAFPKFKENFINALKNIGK